MPGLHSKEDAQFWATLIAIASLSFMTGGSLLADQFRGTSSQVTLVLASGLIAVCSGSAQWLYRTNGNSTPVSTEPAAAPLAAIQQEVARELKLEQLPAR